MKLKKSKSIILIIGSFILILLIAYLFEYIMYSNTSNVCGKFYKESEVKGSTYFHYQVEIANEIRYGSIWMGDLKVKTLDSLKKIECIKVEYSEWSPYFNRIIDKRVLK